MPGGLGASPLVRETKQASSLPPDAPRGCVLPWEVLAAFLLLTDASLTVGVPSSAGGVALSELGQRPGWGCGTSVGGLGGVPEPSGRPLGRVLTCAKRTGAWTSGRWHLAVLCASALIWCGSRHPVLCARRVPGPGPGDGTCHLGPLRGSAEEAAMGLDRGPGHPRLRHTSLWDSGTTALLPQTLSLHLKGGDDDLA